MANTGTRERILSCAAAEFSVAAMLVYIAGLMCSHLSAFRVATNLRIALSRHIATLPMEQIAPAAHPADASIELSHVTFRYDEGEKAKDALPLLTAYRDFVDGYHAWLAELGLAGEASLRLESKAYENKLSGCEYTLWHQWKHFRYYPIEQYDFSELLCELDLEQYRDVEFSTLRLFRDHAALMRRYDIRDEYRAA